MCANAIVLVLRPLATDIGLSEAAEILNSPQNNLSVPYNELCCDLRRMINSFTAAVAAQCGGRKT